MGRVWWGGERRGFKKIAMPNAKISTKHIFLHIFTHICPQLGEYCHAAGKQGTDPHVQESCSPASSLSWPFQAFLVQNMYTLHTHSRINGLGAVPDQKRPETAENGKILVQRVRLANADANRGSVMQKCSTFFKLRHATFRSTVFHTKTRKPFGLA